MQKTVKTTLAKLLHKAGYSIPKHQDLLARRGAQPGAGNGVLSPWLRSATIAAPTPEQASPVTDIFWQRLRPETLQAFEQSSALDSDTRARLQAYPEVERRRDILRLGTHYLSDAFRADTRLTPFSPPDDVHAMVREPIFCGDFYYGDLVTEALQALGRPPAAGEHYLDFGCSSGRVVRNLSLAYPQTHFYGCDPLASAIAWAQTHVPNVDVRQSAQQPPAPFDAAAFDVIYAISIWSHFGRNHARLWLDDMRRLLQPGGLLLWTTHGLGSLLHYHLHDVMRDDEVRHCETLLLEQGYCFIDVFRNHSDWGLDAAEWGQAFMTPWFVIGELLDGWKLRRFTPRRAESNQDVYVFEKS